MRTSASRWTKKIIRNKRWEYRGPAVHADGNVVLAIALMAPLEHRGGGVEAIGGLIVLETDDVLLSKEVLVDIRMRLNNNLR